MSQTAEKAYVQYVSIGIGKYMMIPGSRESKFVWIQQGDITAICPRGCNWYISNGLKKGSGLVYDHTSD
jgi:hypothetical protein